MHKMITPEIEVRLLECVRSVILTKHFSERTATCYLSWIRRFVIFHHRRNPRDMGQKEVTAFLSDLAVRGKVAASTQNQALAALIFLYKDVMGTELPWMDEIVRAKRPARIPVVLSRGEITRIFQHLTGPTRLVAGLLYGGGLRLLEALTLRVKDIDFENREIRVRSGKGQNDRVTMLPERMIPALTRQIPMSCNNIGWIWLTAPVAWRYPSPSKKSIPAQLGNRLGNGCFPQLGTILTAIAESADVTTFTPRLCNATSVRPSGSPALASAPVATLFAIPLQLIFLKTVTTSAPSRNF